MYKPLLVRTVSVISTLVLSMGFLTGCGSETTAEGNGHVYMLSVKGDQKDQYRKLADTFTKKTGIPVDISFMSFDQSVMTLKSELAKSKAPTVFDVDNNDAPLWKDYYADMSDTTAYKEMEKPEYALKQDEKVVAVPYEMDRFGIVYNKQLLQRYFKSNWSSVKSLAELKNFAALKKAADEIQSHKSDLGVDGAFAPAGLDSSSIGSFDDQLPHIPMYYEYRDRGTTDLLPSISRKYLPNYKNIIDLYFSDSTVPSAQLSGLTADDCRSVFLMNKAVFMHNGTWFYEDLKNADMTDKVGILPVYIGVPGEEKAGLTASFMYWALNKTSPSQDQKATRRFLDFILKDEDAKKIVAKEMGFETPFKSYLEHGFASDNTIQRANDAFVKEGRYDIVVYPLPTTQWSKTLGGALVEYAQGTKEWPSVESAFVDGWASEYKTIH